jgi:hypothetical protein
MHFVGDELWPVAGPDVCQCQVELFSSASIAINPAACCVPPPGSPGRCRFYPIDHLQELAYAAIGAGSPLRSMAPALLSS